jgi:malate synthase
VPLYNLMEDAATAEISRSQIWQWLRSGDSAERRTSSAEDGGFLPKAATLADGRKITTQLYDEILPQELARIEKEFGSARVATGHFARAAKLFTEMSQSETFAEFLTLPAYELLD